jgi:hypothetical protein
MMAHRGRDIDIGIGVVQRVKAPEKRHRMLTAMHGVLEKIEQQEGRNKAQPLVGDRPGGQSHTESCPKLRPKGVRRREGEGDKDNIEEPDAEIAEPPPQRRELPLPSRSAEFPNRDGEQTANDYDKGQMHLLASLVPHHAGAHYDWTFAIPVRGEDTHL